MNRKKKKKTFICFKTFARLLIKISIISWSVDYATSEAYPELCQTCKMELLAKIIKG